jgi:hypothetical protein
MSPGSSPPRSAAGSTSRAVPVFLAIALGERPLILGGERPGSPSDAAWSTAYLPPGPWGSLGPRSRPHRPQAYSAIAAGIAVLVVGVVV